MIVKLNDTPSNVYIYKSEGGKNKKYAEYIVNYCKTLGLLAQNKLCVRCSPHLALCLAKACAEKGVTLYAVTGAAGTVKEELEKMGVVLYQMSGAYLDSVADAVSKGAYYFDQFSSQAAIEYYKTVAATAAAELGFKPDNFVDFIGSGATLAGFASALVNTKCYYARMCDNDVDYAKNPLMASVKDKVEMLRVDKSKVYALQQKYASQNIGVVNIGTMAALKAAQGLVGTVLIYWQD